jgi:hypothetical protein
MTLTDEDCFREPGSRYEHEEPVAVAIIEATALVDWSDAAHSPAGTLWLPETLFHQLAETTRLGKLDLNKQARLAAAECRNLSQELAALEAATQDPDVRKAAGLVRARAESVAASAPKQLLLVEGP